MILLGLITSAHGIQGAVKIKTFTQQPENILNYGILKDQNGNEYSLKIVRLISKNSLIALIKGINSRAQAEQLQGIKFYVDRLQMPDLDEEEFYYIDLIGLEAKDLEGNYIGVVKEINNFGAGDFMEILGEDHQNYTIPFNREAVPIVQVAKNNKIGFIQVNKQFFLNTSIKEDKQNNKPIV